MRARESSNSTPGRGAAGTRTTPWAGTTGGAESVGGTGLEPNVAAAVAYAFGLLSGGLVLALDGDDDFVRFHAIQSMAFSFVVIATYVLIGLTSVLAAAIPVVGDAVAEAVRLGYPVLGFGAATLWVALVSTAAVGERLELPVIGPLAAVG